MDACGCSGDPLFEIFDDATAEGDRDRYRRDGPDRTTRLLLDFVRPAAAAGGTLLDIGGGIGVVDLELLRSGAGHAVLVDASPSYLAVAREEARRAGVLDRLEMVEADFARRSDEFDAADVVTLDRVVCCYPDAERLVRGAAARAKRRLGLVLPRDRRLVRLALRLMNVRFRLRRQAYRTYAHPNRLVDALVAEAGLRPSAERTTFFWRVVVYDRAVEAAPPMAGAAAA